MADLRAYVRIGPAADLCSRERNVPMGLERLAEGGEHHELLRRLTESGSDIHFWTERIEEKRDKPTGGIHEVEELLADAYEHFIDVTTLDEHGKLVLRDAPEVDSPISSYRSAIDAAPSPAVQAELAYLLLRLADFDPPPLSEFDLEDGAPRLDRANIPGPKRPAAPPVFRRQLVFLALDAYGRIFSHNVYWLGSDHPENHVDPWLQLVVLDGLRAIFLHLGELEEVELTCKAYDAWTSVMGDDFAFIPHASQRIERHFADTRGFIRGRQLELTVQQAVEEARRKIVISDPDAFAAQVAETVSARFGPVPLITRAQLENKLAEILAGTWPSLADSVQQSLIEADWWKGLLEAADGRDYGPVVVEYARAAEGFLRQLHGSQLNLSNFRDMFKNSHRVKIGFIRGNAPVEELSKKIDRLTQMRNRAAHGDPTAYRPSTLGRAREVRDLVLGSSSEFGLLPLLSENRRK